MEEREKKKSQKECYKCKQQ